MAMLFGGYLDDPDQPYFKMMSNDVHSQMNVAAGQQPHRRHLRPEHAWYLRWLRLLLRQKRCP
ncbi:hypothetical protein ME792_07420 [Lactobacillus delbrueckii]|nr:hypothetical protein ME792_07420 [Lactobacillus delbrueckii]